MGLTVSDHLSPYYYGSYSNRLTARGQVAVPARLRQMMGEEQLGRGLVAIGGEQTCLYLYTHDQFRQVVEAVRTDPETAGDADFQRAFFEEACPLEADAQGRVVLPAALRRRGGLTGPDVVFIGHGDRIEIWQAEARREQADTFQDAYEAKRARVWRRLFGT